MQDTKTLMKIITDEKKLSKYYVAKKCGVSWSTVQFWSKGVFEANPDNKIKLEGIANE